jgi:catechol 2,3-dioxygenase-like lactoylglutathione lyase family enzyme
VARVTGLAPVLLAPDVGAALAYYRDVLGFDVTPYELAPSDYGYAERDGVSIHIAHADHCRPNSDLVGDLFDVYIWVDDVEAVHADLQRRGANILHGPTERPWGMREIRVRELNGYVLGIGQPLES